MMARQALVALALLAAAARAQEGDPPGRLIVLHAVGDEEDSRPRGLEGLEVLEVPAAAAAAAALLAELEADNGVVSYELDARVELVELAAGAGAGAEPNDGAWLGAGQWGMRAIRAPEAWARHTDASAVRTCLIDTGIDFTHADLAANADAARGFNAITRQRGDTVMDDNGHGTHVAGILAAVGNNALGVSGVAQTARLLGCKFLGADGAGFLSDLLACIDYCLREGTALSSNSYSMQGLSRTSSALRSAMLQGAAQGHLFVAAAGNAAGNNDRDTAATSFPAAFALPNMLSVAAVDSALVLAPYSNYGPATTHLAAPGTRVLSTWPGDYLAYLSGTSMAAPHVAGAAALLRGATEGRLTMQEIRGVLLNTTRAAAGLAGKVATGGVLDVAAAMDAAMARAFAPPPAPLLPPSPPPSPPPAPAPAPVPAPERRSVFGFFRRRTVARARRSSAGAAAAASAITLEMDVEGRSCVAFRLSGARDAFEAALREAAAAEVVAVVLKCW
jgi:subtilisin family serine protease